MELIIEQKRVLEFLRLEYKVKSFIEAQLHQRLAGSVSDAAKDGTLIRFISTICPDVSVKYNQNPKETYAKIDNVAILNQLLLNKFGMISSQ